MAAQHNQSDTSSTNAIAPEDVLSADSAALLAEVARLRQHVSVLNAEKADLEMLLAMTTEHADQLEEELVYRVEATLRESEKRFRLIAETMPLPVIISRLADSEIVYVNEIASSLFGLPTNEVVGRKAPDFFDDLSDYGHLLGTLSKQGYVSNYELQGKTDDGKPFWVAVSTRLLTFSDEPCLISALYNITERKHAEQERQRLTANLAAALDQQVTLTNAYSRFVPREFLQILGKENITEVRLGDQIQQGMTVLFSDIRAFTSLSEQLTPQENFNFINSYLSRVSPIIRKHNGFIDKYIGDAVMALFGGDVNDALEAAIEMHQAVTLYNVHRMNHGYRPIRIGIGLHTGNVMLGTVGEEERMEGTVISDAVNLAARLEGLTKLYGAATIVSDHTLFKLSHLTRYNFRFLDKVKVKGKQEPVAVFEIFDGEPDEIVERKLQTQTSFEKGLLHYHSEEFEEATRHFKQVLTTNPEDRAAQLYLQRATYFIQYGVPVDWEGIEAISEK